MSSQSLIDGYTFEWDSLLLGKGMIDGVCDPSIPVSLPLKTLNRHGLIAGATWTGKTKTVQLLIEWLSAEGIPTLIMDIKWDLSWLARPWDAENKHIIKRHDTLEVEYHASWFPVELLSLSDEAGVRLRSTISEFWPLLVSKILSLNETQTSVMGVIFHYCDEKWLALVNIEDLKTVLHYINTEARDEFEAAFGKISPATIGTVLRKLVFLESQWADIFFDEPSFDVYDLVKRDDQGHGIANIVRLSDMQSKPQLFSTFMLSLLAELYEAFPEAWDTDKPKLVMVIDEAHLLFREASKELIRQLENTIKLIRSKGIGIFFCTQLPDDVPSAVLSQLGCKIQHQLRWSTAKDRKAIETAVENYPLSDIYDPENLIMQLWIGEAFVTCLDEKWRPTPLVHCYLRAPRSRMDILTEMEVSELTKQSLLVKKYEKTADNETAHEILSKKIADAKKIDETSSETKGKNNFDTVLKSKFVKWIASDLVNTAIRWALGKLGITTRRSFVKF